MYVKGLIPWNWPRQFRLYRKPVIAVCDQIRPKPVSSDKGLACRCNRYSKCIRSHCLDWNVPADISSCTEFLNFGLHLHLHPYFVYVSSEGSGESGHLDSPEYTLLDVINTKISYTSCHIMISYRGARALTPNPTIAIQRCQIGRESDSHGRNL